MRRGGIRFRLGKGLLLDWATVTLRVARWQLRNTRACQGGGRSIQVCHDSLVTDPEQVWEMFAPTVDREIDLLGPWTSVSSQCSSSRRRCHVLRCNLNASLRRRQVVLLAVVEHMERRTRGDDYLSKMVWMAFGAGSAPRHQMVG